MSFRRNLAVLAMLATAAPMSMAYAATETSTATMKAADEVPPNNSTGTGTAKITYDTATRLLSWTVTWSGLTGPATAAHFHGPAEPGKNAPVVVPIGSGNLTSPDTGHATLTAEQAKQLTSGMWYVNVHTKDHPGGEIRGMVPPPK